MATIEIPKGTVGRPFSDNVLVSGLSQAPGNPNTATFRLRQGDTLIEKTATVGTITFNAGVATVPLSWTPASGDLDIALGGWRQNWKLAWTGGSTIYAPDPNDEENWVVITDNLS